MMSVVNLKIIFDDTTGVKHGIILEKDRHSYTVRFDHDPTHYYISISNQSIIRISPRRILNYNPVPINKGALLSWMKNSWYFYKRNLKGDIHFNCKGQFKIDNKKESFVSSRFSVLSKFFDKNNYTYNAFREESYNLYQSDILLRRFFVNFCGKFKVTWRDKIIYVGSDLDHAITVFNSPHFHTKNMPLIDSVTIEERRLGERFSWNSWDMEFRYNRRK